jgi:hypothetical protein
MYLNSSLDWLESKLSALKMHFQVPIMHQIADKSNSYVLVFTKVIINCYNTIINQTFSTGKQITQTQDLRFKEK